MGSVVKAVAKRVREECNRFCCRISHTAGLRAGCGPVHDCTCTCTTFMYMYVLNTWVLVHIIDGIIMHVHIGGSIRVTLPVTITQPPCMHAAGKAKRGSTLRAVHYGLLPEMHY